MYKTLSCVCLLSVIFGVSGQYPGQYPGQYSGQYPGQYQGQPAGPYSGQPLDQPLTATNYRTDDGQQRSESVDGQGNVKGQYSYVDPSGKTITVKYTAGKDGFKVEGDHLPQAPSVPAAAQPQPQYNPHNPQPYQSQPQYNPQQYQPQYNPHQYQPQPQYNPQQYQAQPQYNPQQFPQQPQYNPQQYQAQPQGFAQQPLQNFPQQPQHRFGNPGGNPGQVSVAQDPSGGFNYQFNFQ